MKERPILMSEPNIRPILEGRKTQTRRVVKSHYQAIEERDDGSLWPWREDCNTASDYWYPCPYGKPGEGLWVRENGWEEPCQFGYVYDADGISGSDAKHYKLSGWKRRPSLFMPRWASRILLEITDVRVERLQDISIQDAHAEGVGIQCDSPMAIMEYSLLWESINGAGSWDANPWVWVIIFKRIEG